MNRAIQLILILPCLLFLTTHCAMPTKKKAPLPASESVRKDLEKAQIELAANDLKRAYGRLKNLVEKNPGTDSAADALMLLGQIDFNRKDYSSAYSHFMSIVNSDVFSPKEGDAVVWAARSLLKLGRLDESLSLANRGLKIQGLSTHQMLDLQRHRIQVLTDLGDRLDALRAIVFVAENEPDPAQREAHRLRALDYVETRLTSDDLLAVADSREFGMARIIAQYRVGLDYFEQRDFGRARPYLLAVTETSPQTEIAERASELLNLIEARRRVNPNTVGAILPLTGKHSALAQRSLRGLKMGLGLVGRNRSDLSLAIADSSGSPDGARRGVERLVAEDHVIAIAGSILSRTAVATATKADELGVPSIAMSQKAGVAEAGESVFHNALTSEMQVRRLVRIAMDDLGLKRFAILFPNDSYGTEFSNLFWDEVLSRGGSIVGVQSYNPAEVDFSGPIKRLAGLYYLEDREDELKTRLRDWYSQQKNINARTKPPEDILPPLVSYDAIFIPDSSKALRQIVPTLRYYEIKGPRLLGTNLWNTRELEPLLKDLQDEDILFVDGLDTSDSNFLRSPFATEFKALFGEYPGPFELQAYDTGLLIRQLLASGARTRSDLQRALSRVTTFPGAIGTLVAEGPRELARPALVMSNLDGKFGPWSPRGKR